MTPTSITIHNTGNPDAGADAAQHAKAQDLGNLKNVAVHYYVDDHEVVQCLEDTWQGWHAGDGSNPKGGNYTSIGIEVCEYKGINQRRAFELAAELVQGLMDKHHITIVKKHQDWTKKYCPHILLDGDGGLTWDWFVRLCNEKGGGAVDRPTLWNGASGEHVRYLQERLNAHGANPKLIVDGGFGAKTEAAVKEFQSTNGLTVDGGVGPQTWGALAKSPASATPVTPSTPATSTGQNTPSDWAKVAWEWVSGVGYMDGNNPKDVLTREMMATILHRLHLEKKI